MTFFVIERKRDGARFPELIAKRKNVGGYTHQEPSLDLPPRLFMTARAARNALTCWLKGPTTVSHYQDREGDWDERWHEEKKPERGTKWDYMVVPVKVCRMVSA